MHTVAERSLSERRTQETRVRFPVVASMSEQSGIHFFGPGSIPGGRASERRCSSDDFVVPLPRFLRLLARAADWRRCDAVRDDALRSRARVFQAETTDAATTKMKQIKLTIRVTRLWLSLNGTDYELWLSLNDDVASVRVAKNTGVSRC